MSVTKSPNQIVDAERVACIAVRDNGNGTVTLYYRGEIPPPLPVTPNSATVTRTQFERALNQLGFYSAFVAAVTARSQSDQIYWQTSQLICSVDSEVSRIAVALGANQTQLDNFFGVAALL